MATQFSILGVFSRILENLVFSRRAWRATVFQGLQRAGHDFTHTHTHTHTQIIGLPWWLRERFYVHFTEFPQWQHSEQLYYNIITGILILGKSTDYIQTPFSILYFLKFSFILTVYLLGHGIHYCITSPPRSQYYGKLPRPHNSYQVLST